MPKVPQVTPKNVVRVETLDRLHRENQKAIAKLPASMTKTYSNAISPGKQLARTERQQLEREASYVSAVARSTAPKPANWGKEMKSGKAVSKPKAW